MSAAPGRAPVCALCGTGCRAAFQAPPAETAPDLDLRPGEPTRSTLRQWLATCRGCGATAPDLVRLPAAARGVVESADYRALAGGGERPFLRWAMIAAVVDGPGEAGQGEGGQALLEAAWAADDAGDEAGAAALRGRAAAAWGEPSTMQEGLRLVDVLRRAGSFEAAGGLVATLLARAGLDETDRAVLEYQRQLIGRGDGSRHLLSSALRPPAQRPHVTHGKAQGKSGPRGFWQRLVGR